MKKTLTLTFAFLSLLSINLLAKEVTITIPGSPVDGSGSQSDNPSDCTTTTTFKCAGAGECYTITYDDGKSICVPNNSPGTSIMPKGVYCDPFPVTITPFDGSPIIYIPNVIEYDEHNVIPPDGLIYRAYIFVNQNCTN
ncbi:MAG: hypothetical protein GC181_08860 [Bacteroidetes bacterium]|nr:hypothetical protein [Bacteroidota bacterium]